MGYLPFHLGTEKSAPSQYALLGRTKSFVRGSTLLGNGINRSHSFLQALYRAPRAPSANGVRIRLRSPLAAMAAISVALLRGGAFRVKR
jgi:hypothetical protein